LSKAPRVVFGLSEISGRCITFISGSKTFNIAGLFTAIAFSENKEIMTKFSNALQNSGASDINLFGPIALTAAYKDGEEWLEQLLRTLLGNVNFVSEYINEKIPVLTMKIPDVTYLGWIDFRKMKLSDKELEHFLIHDAKLWLNMGYAFGKEGSGFYPLKLWLSAMHFKRGTETIGEGK